MLKIMTIIGTRPEIIKLSQIIKVLDKYSDHIIVHTGQNYDYELNEIFFEQLDLRRPDYFLEAVKGTASETIGDIITKADNIIAKIKPDAVLIHGDTNSSLSVISAKRRKVPIFHIEAGNRCFDQRVPEEINRKIVDHLSDVNMPLSEQARTYLLAEGIKPETVIKIGSPMLEVLNANMDKILASNILEKENLVEKKYIVMSVHREENVDSIKNFENLMESIDEIADTYKMPVIVSTHPRTRKKLQEIGYEYANKFVRFSKPFGFHEYICLQMKAFCVISDSGTIAEEGSILNLPAINIRQAHERPECMEEGVFVMSDLRKASVIAAIEVITRQHSEKRVAKMVEDYNVDNVSMKVLRIIYSYTDYINRTVWHKS